jgi:hypothetical protein
MPLLPKRLRALLLGGGDIRLDLVLFGNAFAAIGIGLAALVKLDLGVVSAILVGALAFVALTACMLNKATLLIPACVGGAAVTVAPTILCASVGMRIHPLGTWVGGVIGLMIGLTFAFQAYGQVGKLARRNWT